MYKIANNLAPSYLSDIVPTTVEESTPYNLRSGNNIRLPQCKTESYKRSFFPRMIKAWNSLDTEIKDKSNLLAFKLALKPPKDN